MLSTIREIRSEAHDVYGGRGGEIIAKALWARARHGFALQDSFIYNLPNRPLSTWADYVPYWRDWYDALQVINQWPDGGRLNRDKVAQTALMRDGGVPMIPEIAILWRDPKWGHTGEALSELDSVTDVFERLSPGKYIVKEVDSGGGRGTFSLTVNEDGDLSFDDETFAARGLAERLRTSQLGKGWLLQPRLVTHPALDPMGGDNGLTTIRINTVLTPDGPDLLVAAMKLLSKPGLVDTFAGGMTGNMLAHIDPATGRLTSCYGRRPGHRWLLENMAQHPTTGAPTIGHQVPFFAEALAAALKAAPLWPTLRMAAFDVAVTAGGVSVVEVNHNWETSLPQLMLGEGLRRALAPWRGRLLGADANAAMAKALGG
ncbi:MAG: sugar-transfer associated ATP-grasp domain-containing protein [Pacificimonas sp.]